MFWARLLLSIHQLLDRENRDLAIHSIVRIPRSTGHKALFILLTDESLQGVDNATLRRELPLLLLFGQTLHHDLQI